MLRKRERKRGGGSVKYCYLLMPLFLKFISFFKVLTFVTPR